MKELLISVLEGFGYPVALQGTMNPDEDYPETFITFFCDSTEEASHFDDEACSVDWFFSVIFYSNNPTLVNTKPNEIREALASEGFIPQGRGNDIISDEKTHTGWAMDFVITENL